MENKLEILKAAFQAKKYETSTFRSFSYKHAFGLLNFKKRSEFEALKQKYVFDPSQIQGDLNIINPLSLEPENPWNIQQEYEELRNTVKLDVERIFPDVVKFQDPVVMDIISNVLFVWAMENPKISYRQGMHEVASIVFLIIENDIVQPKVNIIKDPLSSKFQDHDYIKSLDDVRSCSELVQHICDKRYLEHDTYILFHSLMEKIGILYDKGADGQQSPVMIHCKLFFHDYLKIVDLELYRYLVLLNIEPQLFGMRWLRLLFAREVDIENVLKLWDAIIFQGSSEKDVLEAMDWIAVAFLVSLKSKCEFARLTPVLSLDYSDCLQILMKYPQDHNVDLIISSARELKLKYCKPKLPEPLLTSNLVNTTSNNQDHVKSTLSRILKDMKILEPHVTTQMGKGMLRKMHHDLDKVMGILETESFFTKKSTDKQVKTPRLVNMSTGTEHSPLQAITQTAEAVGGQIFSSLSGLGKAVGKAIDESRLSAGSDPAPKSQQLFTRYPASSSSSRLPSSKSMQALFPPADNTTASRKLESSKSLNQIDEIEPLASPSGIYPPPK